MLGISVTTCHSVDPDVAETGFTINILHGQQACAGLAHHATGHIQHSCVEVENGSAGKYEVHNSFANRRAVRNNVVSGTTTFIR